MPLHDRIRSGSDQKIPIAQFYSMLLHYAMGWKTRAEIIAAFAIAPSDEADLDSDYLNPISAEPCPDRRATVARALFDVLILAEVGWAYATDAQFKAMVPNIRPPVAKEIVRLGADVSFSGTALADVAGMLLPVEANGSYVFEWYVRFRSPATTTGIALSLSGPAAPVAIEYTKTIPTSLTAAVIQSARTYNTLQTSAGVDAINSPLLAHITGSLINGPAPGNLQLRAATEIAGSAVVILAGSVGRITKVA